MHLRFNLVDLLANLSQAKLSAKNPIENGPIWKAWVKSTVNLIT
jgi:hypothetical protein